MTQTVIQRSFAPFKRLLPSWAYNPIRSVGTALIGPVLYAYRKGYYRSAFKMAAVSKDGRPIPWYTYPCIDFLKNRDYEKRRVLEFGGGQSSIWWASRADYVVTLEGDKEWCEKISNQMPENVDLCHVSMESKEKNVAEVTNALEVKKHTAYDVIVIDGLHRYEMIPIAIKYLSDDGIVICDNAEGFGFFDGFKKSGLWRVDFFGSAPGVVLPHATSIFFRPSSCFVFDAKFPIPIISKEE